MTAPLPCPLPPPGWDDCDRPPGHTGPCTYPLIPPPVPPIRYDSTGQSIEYRRGYIDGRRARGRAPR